MNAYRQKLLNQHRKPDWDKTHGCFTVSRLVKRFNAKHKSDINVNLGPGLKLLDCKMIALFTKEGWRAVRDKGYCDDFTDIQLDRAYEECCKIKTGWVCGFGIVDMWVEHKMPELSIEKGKPFSLNARYLND